MFRTLIAAILVLFGACQFSENRFAKHRVSPEEIVGVWTITDFGLKSLRDVAVKEHLSRNENVLTFRADGSCTLRTFLRPDAAFGGNDPEYRVYESGCKWRLGEVGHQSLNLTLPSSARTNPYYYFDDEGGKLLIWQYAADPDQWKYIEFEKAQPSSG